MKALMPLAEGFEEIEATTVIDVLRRAGLEVKTAGIPSTIVTGAHGIKLVADEKLDDVNYREFDMLVLVGGPGYKILAKSQKVKEMLKWFDEQKKTIAAICAAPTILAENGLLDERRATVCPGRERQIPRPRDGPVVVDGNIITSQGPGTAIAFALKIVEEVDSKKKALGIKEDLVC